MNFFNRTLSRVRESGYIKNVSRLSVGTIVGQVLSIVLLPIITRLYDSSDYGIAATLNAMVMLLASVAMLRLESTLVLADSDIEAEIAVALGLQILGLFIILMILGSGIMYVFELDFGFFPKGGALYLWMPFWIVCGSVNGLLASWANRHGSYNLISFTRVASPLAAFIVMFLMFKSVGSTSMGLILGHISAALTLLGSLIVGLHLQNKMPHLRRITLAEKKDYLHRFRKFPTYNLLMTFLDQVTAALPIFVFTAAFTPHEAACFVLANNVLRLPSSVIGQGVSQVFYEMSSKLKGDISVLRTFVLNNIRFLSAFAVPFFVIIVFFGPLLFEWVFGSQWQDAGQFSRYLALTLALGLIASPISNISSVIHKQRTHLIISSAVFLLRIASVWIGAAYHSALLAVILYSISESFMILIFLFWIVRLLTRRLATHE